MPWIQSNQCAKWLTLRWRILVPPLHRENNSLLIYKRVPFVLHLYYVGLTACLVGLWSVIYRHKTQGGCIYRPSTASLSWDPSHSNHPDPGVHLSPSTPYLPSWYFIWPIWQPKVTADKHHCTCGNMLSHFCPSVLLSNNNCLLALLSLLGEKVTFSKSVTRSGDLCSQQNKTFICPLIH